VPVLEYPHQRPIGRADGEKIDHHRFERQEDRPEEQKQGEVRRPHHQGNGARSVLSHHAHEVEVEGGGAGDEQLAVNRGMRGADGADQRTRLIAAGGHLGGYREDHDVLPDDLRHRVTHVFGPELHGHLDEALILLATSVGREIHHALHARDRGLGSEPPAQVIRLAHPCRFER